MFCLDYGFTFHNWVAGVTHFLHPFLLIPIAEEGENNPPKSYHFFLKTYFPFFIIGYQMSKIWWADVKISWADVRISMSRCPDLDEQMYQKRNEQMSDEQVYYDH